MKSIKLTIRLHLDTKQKLEELAKLKDMTMTEVIESFIQTDYAMYQILATQTQGEGVEDGNSNQTS